MQGKVNDDKDDQGYSVELAIPWTAFAAGPTPAQPPAAGATWRMNFFVMDMRRDGQRPARSRRPRLRLTTAAPDSGTMRVSPLDGHHDTALQVAPAGTTTNAAVKQNTAVTPSNGTRHPT